MMQKSVVVSTTISSSLRTLVFMFLLYVKLNNMSGVQANNLRFKANSKAAKRPIPGLHHYEQLKNKSKKKTRNLQTASEVPSSAPSTTNAPSDIPSVAPSTSQNPSEVPSGTPSTVPSQAPSPESLTGYVAVFEKLANRLAPLGLSETLNAPIPIVGSSINVLVGGSSSPFGGSINSLLSMTQFVEDLGDTFDRLELETSLLNNLSDRVDSLGGILEFSDLSPFCQDGRTVPPIKVEGNEDTDTNITFCTKITFQKRLAFDTEGLFDSIPDNLAIESAADIDYTVTLHFSGQIANIDDDGSDSQITLEPIIASVQASATASLDIIVGVFRLTTSSSNADVSLNVTFEMDGFECNEGKCDFDLDVPTAQLDLSRDLEPSSSFTGKIDSPPEAEPWTFDIKASQLLSNLNFDQLLVEVPEAFGLLSPNNALNSMLRVFDSAFTRAQENEIALMTSLPLTQRSFAKNIFTGSFLTSQRSLLFARPERFDRRAQKSTTLVGSTEGKFPEDFPGDDVFRLVVVRDELLANPDSYADLLLLDDAAYCDFFFDNSTSASDLVKDLVGKLNLDGNCTGDEIRACLYDDENIGCLTDEDNGNIFGCDVCDIVVGMDADNRVFFTSNAFIGDGMIVNDVTLIGLFNGIPVNDPAFANLVPRFSDFATYVSAINDALENQFHGVSVDFNYVAYEEAEDSRPRLEVDLGFDFVNSLSASWNVSQGIGDFQGITLNAMSELDVTTEASFAGKIAVVLGPNLEDQIVFFTTACNGTGLNCTFDELVFQVDYTQSGEDYVTQIIVSRGMNVSTALGTALTEIATVSESGRSGLAVTFLSDISAFTIRVPKNCTELDERKPNFNVSIPNLLECTSDTQRYDLEPNSFGITDTSLSKVGFEILVGDLFIDADFAVTGDAEFNAALNDVVEVEARLDAALTGNLNFILGYQNTTLVRFSEWITELSNLRGDGAAFLQASSTWSGDFNAEVTPLSPFDVGVVSATGSFAPYNIDFFEGNSSSNYPDIEMEVSIPNIGLILQLSYDDVVGCLSVSSAFLVGDGSTDDCTGGILSAEIGGFNIFSTDIPGIGFRPCDAVGFLRILPDAIQSIKEDLREVGAETFNALFSKLEALLTDLVGGAPDIKFQTQEEETKATLTITLELKWDFTQTHEIATNIGKIFGDGNIVSDLLAQVLNDIVPESGGAIEFGTELRFTSSVAVEFEKPANQEFGTTKCFLLGGDDDGVDDTFTGFDLSFIGSGLTEFGGAIGSLGGSFSSSFEFLGDDGDGLALSIRAPNFPDGRFEVDPANINLPALLLGFSSSFTGGLSASVLGEIPLLGASVDFGLSFPSLNSFLNREFSFNIVNDGTRLEDLAEPSRSGNLAFSATSIDINNFGDVISVLAELPIPGLPNLESLMLSGDQLDLFISSFDMTLGFLETSLFGSSAGGGSSSRGGLANFDAPFIGKGIFSGLGGKFGTSRGTGAAGSSATGSSNFLANIRTNIRSALSDGLALLADEFLGDIVVGVTELLDGALKDAGVVREGVAVTADCFGDDAEADAGDCGGDTVAILWTIPLGQDINVDFPLDFSLSESLETDVFALEIEIPQPELVISWDLALSIGFHKDAGFFLNTALENELCISATLQVGPTEVSSRLLFLNAMITDLNVVFGAQVTVDAVQGESSGQNVAGFQDGWMKLSEVASSVSDLFAIAAEAHTIVKAKPSPTDDGDNPFGVTFDVQGLGTAGNFIPKLVTNFIVQARATTETRRRKLSREGEGRRLIGRSLKSKAIFKEHANRTTRKHAARILHALADRDLECTTALDLDPECPLDGGSFCMRLLDLSLDASSLAALVNPVIKEIREVTDPIGEPLLDLIEPIPGVSDIAGRDVTVLDIAEQKARNSRERRGVQSVRKFLEIYDSIISFIADVNLNEGLIDLAERCEPNDDGGLSCCGGLFSDECSGDTERRLLTSPKDEIGPSNTTQSVLGSKSTRQLLACPAVFKGPDCSAGCTCEGISRSAQAKCKAKRLACRTSNTEGLTFPLFSDFTKAVDLLLGKDVRIVEFAPPPVEFGFSAEIFFLLYTPPNVELIITFEFSATVRVGVSLDTRGVREAVTQNAPEKALNSFGFIDTFDGVDEALIALTGSVGLTVQCNAAIVKIGVSGTVGFVATVDFFDPYPETSGGLVRPYELLVLGSTPDEWFEFSFEIFVSFRVFIKIGIFAGFFSITLYTFEKSFDFTLLGPIFLQPPAPDTLVEISSAGSLLLGGAAINAQSGIVCSSLAGSLGDEDIECFSGNQFHGVDGVKNIRLSGASGPVTLQNVKSQTNLENFMITGPGLTLDYIQGGGRIISDAEITIGKSDALLGSALIEFSSAGNWGAKILLPQPEVPELVTTFKGDCSREWTLEGHTNLAVEANAIKNGCNIFGTNGNIEASLTLDLATGKCADGVVVTLDTNSDNTWVNVAAGHEFDITLGGSFTYIEIVLPSQCSSNVHIRKTLPSLANVFVQGGFEATDNIIVGGAPSLGLDSIFADIKFAGNGEDTIQIDDSGSPKAKNGTLSSGLLSGLLPGMNQTIAFSGLQVMDVTLSKGANEFAVVSTPRFSTTTVNAGEQEDKIFVTTTQGHLNLNGGGGNDLISVQLVNGELAVDGGYGNDKIEIFNIKNGNLTVHGGADDDVIDIYGLDDEVVAIIYGNAGNDTLTVDGRGTGGNLVNLLGNSIVRWSGGDNDDLLHVFFTSAGSSVVEIFDDLDGVNKVWVDCADFACSVLSRESFLANIHDMANITQQSRGLI